MSIARSMLAPIEELSDDQVMVALERMSEQFTEQDYLRLEFRLRLVAGSLGWTGDPLKQPPRVILSTARQILEDRS